MYGIDFNTLRKKWVKINSPFANTTSTTTYIPYRCNPSFFFFWWMNNANNNKDSMDDVISNDLKSTNI